MPRRVLVSWVGHADLRAMAASLPPSEQDAVLRAIGIAPTRVRDGSGPLRTLLANESFDEVHLLSNYGRPQTNRFVRWLGCRPIVHPVDLADPTDYAAIFTAANAVLAELAGQGRQGQPELCLYLSPGTPAMAAIWVLLGKTRYPATFYQSHESRSWRTDIPFDITIDVVPQLLRQPDMHLQQLAAKAPQEVQGFENIIGDSKGIRLAVGRARRASVRDVPVLLLGESGTGKEMFAQAIHQASSRRHGRLLAINCAAIPELLLESQLFGHAKGAFTDARSDRPGALEEAGGGTLFLDEIGECSPAVQAKLLRVLQPPAGSHPCCRRFTRLGESRERESNVRIIAATNCDLHQAIGSRRFREDLYYRLAVVTIHLPPLRERRADIPLIAEALLKQINHGFDGTEPGFHHKSLCAGATAFLKRQDWPGNVRELHNVLVQAAVMTDGSTIQAEDVAVCVKDGRSGAATDLLGLPLGDEFCLAELLERVQRHYLQRAMAEAGGIKTQAARLLGIQNYQTLDAQLKRLGVRMVGQ